MASSMFPSVSILVPQELIELSNEFPSVLLNLRTKQREIPENESEEEKRSREWGWYYMDGGYMHQPVAEFLKGLTPKSKVLMSFQGYGASKVGTAVIEISSIYWTREHYPRLDFDHPKVLDEVNGCPNFWGGFILAITKFPQEEQASAVHDNDFSEFIRKVRQTAVTAQ